MKRLKFLYWVNIVAGAIMAIFTIATSIIATQGLEMPYEQRSFILILALFGLLLFWRFWDTADKDKQKIKDKKAEEKEFLELYK